MGDSALPFCESAFLSNFNKIHCFLNGFEPFHRCDASSRNWSRNWEKRLRRVKWKVTKALHLEQTLPQKIALQPKCVILLSYLCKSKTNGNRTCFIIQSTQEKTFFQFSSNLFFIRKEFGKSPWKNFAFVRTAVWGSFRVFISTENGFVSNIIWIGEIFSEDHRAFLIFFKKINYYFFKAACKELSIIWFFRSDGFPSAVASWS